MKIIKRLIVPVIILLIVVAVAITFYIDSIARTAVERGANHSLAVPTTLGGANVRILAGGFAMNDLHVANPTGYESTHFLTLGNGDISVSLATLMKDTIVVPTLHLENIDIIIEKVGDKSNLDVIMANVGRDKDPQAKGKKYVINETVIRNVTVRVIMPPVSTAAKPLIVTVPELRFENIGSDTENGVMLSQVTGTIVASTVRAVVMNAPDVFGNLVVASVDGALAKAGELGKLSGELIGQAQAITGQASQIIGDITKEGAGALEGVTGGAGDAAKKVEEGVGGAVRGLGGLIPGGEEKKDD